MQVYESKTAPDEIKVAVLITLVRAHAAMHACGSPNYSHGVCALAVQLEKKEIQEKLSLLGKLCWEKFEVARGREEGGGRTMRTMIAVVISRLDREGIRVMLSLLSADILFLKHDSSILRQSSNPVCGS